MSQVYEVYDDASRELYHSEKKTSRGMMFAYLFIHVLHISSSKIHV